MILRIKIGVRASEGYEWYQPVKASWGVWKTEAYRHNTGIINFSGYTVGNHHFSVLRSIGISTYIEIGVILI